MQEYLIYTKDKTLLLCKKHGICHKNRNEGVPAPSFQKLPIFFGNDDSHSKSVLGEYLPIRIRQIKQKYEKQSTISKNNPKSHEDKFLSGAYCDDLYNHSRS